MALEAAQKVVEVHKALADFLRHGQTLAQIDRFVLQTLQDLSCVSCFHRYKPGRMPPFPSQACLSVNECVVHGTAGYLERPMVEGDVLTIEPGLYCKAIGGIRIEDMVAVTQDGIENFNTLQTGLTWS